MGLLNEVLRLESAKQAQYSLLLEYDSPVGPDDRIDAYTDLFRELLANSGSASVVTDYYKCQAVDYNTATWTGYKAIDHGTYFSFEDIPTTGLTYIGNPPATGSIYSQDGRIHVAGMFSGVVIDPVTDEATVYLSKGTTIAGTTATLSAGTESDGVLVLS